MTRLVRRAGSPQASTAPSGGSEPREAGSVGAEGLSAGSPQASTAPSGGSAFHAVKSLGALFFNEVATRGMGLANVLAAVQSGITRLGGCPYAPSASGNVTSEDAIHMLDAMGYDTGINLPQLLAVARLMPQIVGHDMPGQVAKAGRITDLHPAPDFVEGLREART